jgi:hypothetical protein
MWYDINQRTGELNILNENQEMEILVICLTRMFKIWETQTLKLRSQKKNSENNEIPNFHKSCK